MDMLKLIRSLEGHSNSGRREIILDEILQRNWMYQLHSYSWKDQDGTNILLDFQTGPPEGKILLLCGHYDVFAGSPGANDDASAIAILLETAEKLRERSLSFHLRFAFFDQEEPTPWWRFPIGSTMYVKDFGVENLVGVIDLELCGIGDSIAFWPVEGILDSHFLKLLQEECRNQQIQYDCANSIPNFYADYLPFRQAGFSNAVCLTAFPWKERKKILRFVQVGSLQLLLQYSAWRYLRLPTIPTIFQHYHNKTDRSEFLSERTLKMMRDFIVGAVERLHISHFPV